MMITIMLQISIRFLFGLIRKKEAASMCLRASVRVPMYGIRFLGPATAASVIILRYLWKF